MKLPHLVILIHHTNSLAEIWIWNFDFSESARELYPISQELQVNGEKGLSYLPFGDPLHPNVDWWWTLSSTYSDSMFFCYLPGDWKDSPFWQGFGLDPAFFADVETHESHIDYQRSWHINPSRYRAVLQIPWLYAQRYFLMLTDKDHSHIWSLFRKNYRILSSPHYQPF